MTQHLIAPRQLPDGNILWEETGGDVGETVARLRAYDPRCSLELRPPHEWLITRLCEDGERRVVGRRVSERVPHGDRLVAELASHDTRRGYDPIADVDAHNDKIDASNAQKLSDETEGHADHLAWALGRDLSEPAQDGRLYALGGP